MKPKCSSFSLLVILLTAMALLFSEPIYIFFIDMGWVKNIQASFKPSLFCDICALVALAVGCLIIDNAMDKAEEKTAERMIGLSVIILPLFIVLRINHGESYVGLSMLPFFKYADMPILALLLLLIESIRALDKEVESNDKVHEESEDSNLLYDNNEADDVLGRLASVKRNANLLITENNKKGAFGVAVTGGWGSGKSWYMTALKKELEVHGETCISFRPWVYDDKELTSTFCKLLEDTLHNNGVETGSLKALAKDLLKEYGGIGTVSSLLLGLDSQISREELIDTVKTEFGRAKRPTFVFMDECDRLNKEELLQVFSLIRNICDFPYLCYILAYDKEQVGETLLNSGGIKYTSKMIDYTIPLESLSNKIIIDTLCDLFNKHLGGEDFYERLNRLELIEHLPTLREFKRFWNQIYPDYCLQKEILDNTYISQADWIVLELIKYKDKDLYDTINLSTATILAFVKDSWNSPLWAFTGNWKDGSCNKLLRFLFPKEQEPSNGESIFGIANLIWTKVYFSITLPDGVRDCHEYERSLNNSTFESDIDKWIRKGDKGLQFVIWSYYIAHEINNVTAIRCVLEYIWSKCDIKETPFTMSAQGCGYTKYNQYHSFLGINDFIGSYHFLGYLFSQVYAPIDNNGNDIQVEISHLAMETNRQLELLALILNLVRGISDTNDMTYKMATSNIKVIWNRIILLENSNKDIDTLNILEILHSCTLENTYEDMGLPLIKENPLKWLSATLRICKDSSGKEYMLLSEERMHALFDSLKKAESTIPLLNDIVKSLDNDVKLFIEEYKSLFAALADNTVYKDKDGIPEKYRRPSILEKENYPILAKVPMIGSKIFMPIDEALSQLANSSFWKGSDLRIKRKSEVVYLAQQI